MTRTKHRMARAIVVAVLVSAGIGTAAAQGDVSSHPMIGEPAPPFDLEKVGGGELSLADLKGKYIVLHFGASW